ncbi:DNA polymerase subunit gamma-2, mitochondrial isoform X2 [Hyla sarda]|uniref:DNA polymerase subunit gamma-2, mitochondrial isoform X2 n=1 Tax=Hyla sarda TaxID=327740 RepID=UPI0024C33204|nr:DNA polymerase subunit gamma-2, mitochondrial isoform X2 [Hyla sarda]
MSSAVVRMSWGRRNSALKTIRGSIRMYAASSDRIRDILLDLCRRRRFILGDGLSAASVIEGGHSLGPLGSEMKKNIIKEWWNMVVLSREQVLPIDTALHTAPEPGSPALTLFRIRPDHRDNDSVVSDERQLGILRHDLLHGALSHYAACLELVSGKLPFGIAEVGKCFHTVPVLRDDGAPLTRPGERTAASLCWFSSAKMSSQWRDYWLRHRLLWWRRFAQVPSGFSSGDHQDADGAKTFVINYDFPWGREAVETLRTMDDSALTQVHAGTGAKLHGRDGRRSLVPHVVWLNSDLDRGLLAYLSDALHVTENLSPRGKEHVRTVLRIHPSLAPIKVAVDLGKGPAVDLRLVGQELSSELRKSGISVWPGYLDTVQTPMEQVFTKYDEMGVLFTVLVSDVTLESGLLHLRNRDTTIKETVHVSKLREFLTQYMSAAN